MKPITSKDILRGWFKACDAVVFNGTVIGLDLSAPGDCGFADQVGREKLSLSLFTVGVGLDQKLQVELSSLELVSPLCRGSLVGECVT
jgi:hypothetical protein